MRFLSFFRRKVHPVNQAVIDLFRVVYERNMRSKKSAPIDADDNNIRNQIDLSQISEHSK